MNYQGVRLGFQLSSKAGSRKRISKAILWDTTEDLLTRIIRGLHTTKEIWSSRGLSSPWNRAALGISDAYIWVLVKYLGSYLYNYNILYLTMFPPGPVFKEKSEKVARDGFVCLFPPSSPSCPSPTCLKPHFFPKKGGGGKQFMSNRAQHWLSSPGTWSCACSRQHIPSEDEAD